MNSNPERTAKGGAVSIHINVKKEVPVKYLHANCGVRYWEDANVNGIEDTDGTLIPCRDGDLWCPVIDLDTGKIEGWPEGTTASIHYKVCDNGIYTLLNANREKVTSIDGYVPSMLCPKDNCYGDYIIMDIGHDGVIAGWKVNLLPFERGDE